MLTDVRVLDLTTGIAGPYATKLLADAGADVVKAEPAGGDPLRRWSAAPTDRPEGDDGILFRYLHAGKRSVTATAGVVARLAEGADIVVCDGPPPGARRAGQVIVSISPFGLAGPWADRPATEFTLQAWCGSTASRGSPEQPPVAAGGRLGEWIGGAYAGLAALATLRGARASGAGTHVDLSLLECMAVTMNTYTPLFASFLGWREAPPGPVRTVEIPSIEPTADGFVGFCTITATQFHDFLSLIERPDLIDDAGLATAYGRSRRMDEMHRIIRAWTEPRTTAEIIEAATAWRIPVAPIGNGATVTGFEQFVERGVFVPLPGGEGALMPRLPYHIEGLTCGGPATPAPALGQHDREPIWPARDNDPEPGHHPDDLPLPLEDLRIADFTAFWAGPAATHSLAALGADVIKVESIQRPDGMRFTTTNPRAERWWEWGPVFHGANAGKRSVTLDLNRPEGVDLAKALIARSDAVVENFSPRVMEHFGLDWPAVRAANPATVMVRMPAFGLDGPWRDRTGFAQNMEQASGLAWITGFADGPPLIPRGACDPLAGMHAAFALLIALDQRRRDGEGRLVEVTMVEATLNVAAEQVLEFTSSGRLLTRDGNRDPAHTPQGVYPCAGDEHWVAVAVATDRQWQGLSGLLGREMASRADLVTAGGRRAAHDEIDDQLATWCAGRPLDEAVERLLAAGVPAAPAVAPRDIAANPQLRARGFFEPVDHPVTGRHDLPGLPFRLEGRTRGWLRSPAPTLGQHNDEVLGDLLGAGQEDLDRMAAERLIGTRPVGT